jgi:hypothetical protein
MLREELRWRRASPSQRAGEISAFVVNIALHILKYITHIGTREGLPPILLKFATYEDTIIIKG